MSYSPERCQAIRDGRWGVGYVGRTEAERAEDAKRRRDERRRPRTCKRCNAVVPAKFSWCKDCRSIIRREQGRTFRTSMDVDQRAKQRESNNRWHREHQAQLSETHRRRVAADPEKYAARERLRQRSRVMIGHQRMDFHAIPELRATAVLLKEARRASQTMKGETR